MKILSNKEYEKLKNKNVYFDNREKNDLINNFENVIIAILEKVGLDEIKVEKSYFNNTGNHIIQTQNIDNSFTFKIVRSRK